MNIGYNDAEKLLQEARKIIRDNYEIKRNSGGDFNIFSVLNIERDEVFTHSNMIYSFLNSESEHFMKDKYLKLFLKIVLNINEPYLSKKWYVEREWPFDDGRIDFVIYNDEYFLAVEMKIDAVDQPKQLKRYEDYAKTRRKNYIIYYLTLNGKESSAQSKEGMETKVHLISFEEHIMKWLQMCINITPVQYRVYDALKQYRELVDKIISNKGEEKEMVSLLMNKDNYMAFKELQKSEIAMKQKFIEKFCGKLEEKFKENNLGFQSIFNVNGFFCNPKGVIQYALTTDKTLITEKNIVYNLIYIIEISETEGSLIYGYRLKNIKTNTFITSMENELSAKDIKSLKKQFNFSGVDLNEVTTGIWVYWNYVYAEDKGIYAFREFNNNVIKMLDIEGFEKEMDRIINIISVEYNFCYRSGQNVNV